MRSHLDRILTILPRHMIDELAKTVGNEKPWHSDRKTLETMISKKDSEEVRREVLDFIRQGLML